MLEISSLKAQPLARGTLISPTTISPTTISTKFISLTILSTTNRNYARESCPHFRYDLRL